MDMQDNRDDSETTIIMLDDNMDEIFLARRALRKVGITNRLFSEKKPERIFETLNELIQLGHDKKTFLILLDVKMPKLNGIEVLERIRNHPDFKDIPVLMFSASDSEVDMFQSYEAGSNGYIVKPFSAEEFHAALQNIPSIRTKLLS